MRCVLEEELGELIFLEADDVLSARKERKMLEENMIQGDRCCLMALSATPIHLKLLAFFLCSFSVCPKLSKEFLKLLRQVKHSSSDLCPAPP